MSRYKIALDCEPWQKAICSNCNASNWILMTKNMEACKCHKCEKTFWISEKIYDDFTITSTNHEHIIETARSTVNDLLEKMSIEATLDVYIGETYGTENRTPVHIDIHGDDLNILIGHRGETLNALQYIARLILGKELEHAVPLSIDVGGYRKRREEQIRQLARRMANQVIETQHKLSLEPMPANERRLAHLELQDDQYVYTESTGAGRNRKVVIFPQ